MLEDEMILHRTPPDQMLLDDALEHGRVAPAIPRSLRIDHGDGPPLTDAEAVGLGAIDPTPLREPQLLEPALEVLPGRDGAIALRALGFGLVGAEEDVPADAGDAEGLGLGPLLLEEIGVFGPGFG
jgi:hypothetical protein